MCFIVEFGKWGRGREETNKKKEESVGAGDEPQPFIVCEQGRQEKAKKKKGKKEEGRPVVR